MPEEDYKDGQKHITQYFTGGSQKIVNIKLKKHPRSLLKDESIPMRRVEEHESIFDIIMPWKTEQKEEEKKQQQLKGKGRGWKKSVLDDKKQKSIMDFMPNKSQSSLSSQNQAPSTQKKEEEEEEDAEQLKRLAKVKKVVDVQKLNLCKLSKDVQGILINPKWKPSTQLMPSANEGAKEEEIGTYKATTFQDIEKSKKKQQMNQKDSSLKGTEEGKDEESEQEDEEEEKFLAGISSQANSQGSANNRGVSQGITMEDFKQLKFPPALMKDGMLFIWVEKEYIFDVICHLENENFYYVENVCWVMLDESMRKGNLSQNYSDRG